MSGFDDGVARDVRDLLAGEPVGRRTMLRIAAGAALGLPAVLSACGDTSLPPGARNTTNYEIDPLSTSPPLGDLERLLTRRAKALGMHPQVPSDTLPEALRRQTRLGRFNPQTNARDVPPPVVVGVTGAAQLEPIAALGIKNGVKIVSYPVALRNRTAAIVVDAADAARMLAAHAASWARARHGASGSVLLVLPRAALDSPYAPAASSIEQALRDTLARLAPGVEIAGTTQADDYAPNAAKAVEQALRSHPQVRIVLAWNDEAARGAAQALRHQFSREPRDTLYAGALGLPAVASRATFTELQRGDVLRAVVAARAAELANAMVDLPQALLDGKPVHDVRLELRTLTPNSAALADHAMDYAQHPEILATPAFLNGHSG